jgi:phosphoglycolate phosphatase
MIRNLIFDFDGTLADTQEGILATEREMLRRMKLPEPSREQMCNAIGLPLPESLRRGCDIPPARVDEAVLLYRALFFDYAPQHIIIFDGVKETLADFADRSLRMAIATSRSSNTLEKILETHGMDGYFPHRVTADCGIKAKPAPDMVLHLLETMAIKAEETLVVGDTTFDLEMGKGAGCLTAGVSYGNHSREQLATVSPDWIVDRFDELRAIVGI